MNEGVREAGRCVRPYLVELLGSTKAAEVDEELARLLNDGDIGEGTEAKLRNVLDAHEATRVFLEEVLEDAPACRPPGVSGETRYSALPGDAAPVGSEKFVCPEGDYVWYLAEVGSKIQLCPTHQCSLEPA